MRSLTPLAIAALLVAAPPVRDPRGWPDDAIDWYLDMFVRLQTLGPIPADNAAPAMVTPVVEEAGRRRLAGSRKLLAELFEKLPWPAVPGEPGIGGLRQAAARSLARIDLAPGAAEALGRLGPVDALCVPQPRPASAPEEVLALAFVRELALDPATVGAIRDHATLGSPCLRRYVSIELARTVQKPGPKDQKLFRGLLEDGDEEAQLLGLQALLRGASPGERRKVAQNYLRSTASKGSRAAELARRAAEGKLQEADLAPAGGG